IPPKKHTSEQTLVIKRPLLVLSFGSGVTGHDGGIPVEADLDLIPLQRLVLHAAGLAVLQVLRPLFGKAALVVMDVVLVQERLKEIYTRLEPGPIEGLDELRQLALVAGRAAKDPAADRQQEDRDREEMLHRPTPFQGGACPALTPKRAKKRRAPRQVKPDPFPQTLLGQFMTSVARRSGECNRRRGQEAAVGGAAPAVPTISCRGAWPHGAAGAASRSNGLAPLR